MVEFTHLPAQPKFAPSTSFIVRVYDWQLDDEKRAWGSSLVWQIVHRELEDLRQRLSHVLEQNRLGLGWCQWACPIQVQFPGLKFWHLIISRMSRRTYVWEAKVYLCDYVKAVGPVNLNALEYKSCPLTRNWSDKINLSFKFIGGKFHPPPGLQSERCAGKIVLDCDLSVQANAQRQSNLSHTNGR